MQQEGKDSKALNLKKSHDKEIWIPESPCRVELLWRNTIPGILYFRSLKVSFTYEIFVIIIVVNLFPIMLILLPKQFIILASQRFLGVVSFCNLLKPYMLVLSFVSVFYLPDFLYFFYQYWPDSSILITS